MAVLIPDVIMDLTVSATGEVISANALSVPVTVNAVETPISLYSTETIGPVGPGGPSAVSNNPGNVATLGNDYLILVQGPVSGNASPTQVVKGNDSRLSVATLSTPGLLRPLDGVSSHVLQGDGTWGTPVGAGDMLKRDYDVNNDGIVDKVAPHAASHLTSDPIAKATATASGMVPTPPNDGNTYLSGLATFARVLPAGVIMPFGGGTAPAGGWLLCDGNLYPTATYPDLFAVLGYTYGGSGASFNVPDLRGRAPVGAGSGPGLTPRALGGTIGEETHLLTIAELAAHTHGLSAHTHTLGNHTHLGVDHLHSMQGHTHAGVNHLHAFTGVDHTHPIPTGQFSHTHGVSTGVMGMNNPVQGLGAGGATFYTPQGIGIAAATLPAGGTGASDRSLASNTAGADRDLTTGGPSVASTGAADRGLTTGGPSTNTSDGPSVANTTSIGSGTGHNTMQPSLFLSYIVKT